MHINPWNAYRKISTLTAPPGRIVLMLYDGALQSLEKALTGFAQSDPAEANMIIHNNLQRAQEILRELNYALNMDQGGDCALTLRRLYEYFDRLIWDSNVRKRREGIDEVIRHLTVVRDAWATMLSRQESPREAPEEAIPALAPA